MAVRKGTAAIASVRKGTTAIAKIYKGTTEVYSSAPPSDPELLTNANSTTGWAPSVNNGTTLTYVGGRLRVTGTGAAAQFETGVSTTIGDTYRVLGTMHPHEADRARMGINGSTFKYADVDGTAVDFTFVASASTSYVVIGAGGNAAWVSNGEYAEFSGLSVKKV